ncbi:MULTISPECIES: CDP-glycerol glycerophosphotransferase family protein [unclassified Novosphingobium]|uniref:CDP-glycerol glycerophosphotransferase family protein n=1 Tax=unclassified Novosphingobium TaxID=2644732 RepID=UPI001F29FA72|nr:MULTISPECIES: CDP-glycerol glycerophosphotransferase family protein [unclassified Novosphingobium]
MLRPIELRADLAAPQKVCFFFNAQLHHVFHAMPLAVEMSRDPRFAVDIIAMTEDHVTLAKDIAARHGAGNLDILRVGSPLLSAITGLTGGATPPKLPALASARSLLTGYDAIVVPERTSLLLRFAGLHRTAFIHTCHGAGDRAVGYDRRIRQFDFVLLAGEKQRRRMLEKRLIREGHYAVVGYGKFDLTERGLPDRLFPDDRPIVLYNPHFSKRLSSWREMGLDVIRQFARDDRFNLIVAPHIRLYDNRRRRARMERQLAEFASLPNIHVDLGSPASVDMRYTRAASVYLGDVSSQVYEFVVRPRPCLFLDAQDVQWEGNPNYRHWQYGPVHRSSAGIVDKVATAMADHDVYAPTQREGVAETFDREAGRSSARAARAVGDFLARREAARGAGRLPSTERPGRNVLVHE